MLHLSHLLGPKIKRGATNDSELIPSEYLLKNSVFQASESQFPAQDHSAWSLHGQARSSRCVSSHSDSSLVSKIPSLQFSRKTVLLPRSSFRPLCSPIHLHQNGFFPSRTFKEEGGKRHSLSRRPHFLGKVGRRGKESSSSGSGILLQPRVPHKSGKINSKTLSKSGLARLILEDGELFNRFTEAVSLQAKKAGGKDRGFRGGVQTVLGETPGPDGVRCSSLAGGKVPRSLSSQVLDLGSCTITGPAVSHLSEVKGGGTMVDYREEPETSSSHQGHSSGSPNFLGCVKIWLRESQQRWKVHSRNLVNNPIPSSYQLSGAPGGPSSTRFSPGSPRLLGFSLPRQQDRLLRDQEQGIQQLPYDPGVDRNAAGSPEEEKTHSIPGVLERKQERNRRCPVEEYDDSDRMESLASLFSGFGEKDRMDPADRPHGYTDKHKTPLLCHSVRNQRSDSNRLLRGGSKELGEGLCLPTSQPPHEDTGENPPVSRDSPPHCSVSSFSTLVSGLESQVVSLPSSSRTSITDRSGAGSFNAREAILTLTRVGFVESMYSAQVGPIVSKRLSAAFRSSTLSNYEGCWKTFQAFIRDRPDEDISLSLVTSFLDYLFETKGLGAKTVLGYRVALSEPLRLGFNLDLSSDIFKKLARAQFLARPPSKKLVPNWDVSPILEKLASNDFRSETCSLENLLTKSIFLVALATGNRASELAAIDRHAVSFRQQELTLLLPVRPNFLFKNQTMNRSPPNIQISRFPDVEPELCPVTTLQAYLRRTREALGSALFVHPSTGRNLQRPSISLRITSFIADVCPGSLPRMHDVRKMAASLAWTRGVPPGDIVSSVFWSSSNVFIKHYLFKAVMPSRNFVALNRTADE